MARGSLLGERNATLVRKAEKQQVVMLKLTNLSDDVKQILSGPDAMACLASVAFKQECELFNGVTSSKARRARVDTTSGDRGRFNCSLSAFDHVPDVRKALEAVLDAAKETARMERLLDVLEPFAPKALLATRAHAEAQPPHMDGPPGTLDERQEEVALARRRRFGAAGRAVPATAIIAMSQGASLLVSPYTREQDVYLLDAKPKFPPEVLPMRRVFIEPWTMAVFLQDVVHAGDSALEDNFRLHMYFNHPDVEATLGATTLVAQCNRAAAAYYRAPAAEPLPWASPAVGAPARRGKRAREAEVGAGAGAGAGASVGAPSVSKAPRRGDASGAGRS